MTQTKRLDDQRKFLPSLEGVRGYAFLLVFFAHCCVASRYSPTTWWRYPVGFLAGVAWVAVPVFFVLSGYLICGILIDTREREGYFKIFYSRRILRVFPLYYITLLVVGLCCVLKGFSLGLQFWSHFLYIQNLVPGYASIFKIVPWRVISHLWSMGVEEQFYLLWPLVVWICPNRRVLLRITLVLIVFSFALRLASPSLDLSPWFMYIWTPTRVDAILMGAVLAMIRDKPVYRWIESIARYVVLSGVAAIGLMTLGKGYSALGTSLRAAMMISLWNIIAAGIVVAVMRQGSFLCQICSKKGICWLGARSYGLYLFHVIYLFWFFGSFAPRIESFMPLKYALLVAGVSAFALTLLLAGLCYRFIEEPAMNLKKRLKYGAVRPPRAVREPSDQMYADAD